jgi:hypothetical protein
MKTFFILFSIALLASCKKERGQSTITQSSRNDTTGVITQTPPQDTIGSPPPPAVPPSDTSVVPIPPTPLPQPDTATIPIGSAQLQFTIANIITYRFNENIAAKEYVQNGLKNIFIEVQKDSSTYQINIIGTDTQVNPGIYPFTGSTYSPNSSMFTEWFKGSLDVLGIEELDFSLKVVSYKDGYLDATFNSSRVTNGIISHLKIEQ